MAISITIDIWCDKCGHWTHLNTSSVKKREMSRAAKALGWVRKGNDDICPQCQGKDPTYWRKLEHGF